MAILCFFYICSWQFAQLTWNNKTRGGHFLLNRWNSSLRPFPLAILYNIDKKNIFLLPFNVFKNKFTGDYFNNFALKKLIFKHLFEANLVFYSLFKKCNISSPKIGLLSSKRWLLASVVHSVLIHTSPFLSKMDGRQAGSPLFLPRLSNPRKCKANILTTARHYLVQMLTSIFIYSMTSSIFSRGKIVRTWFLTFSPFRSCTSPHFTMGQECTGTHTFSLNFLWKGVSSCMFLQSIWVWQEHTRTHTFSPKSVCSCMFQVRSKRARNIQELAPFHKRSQNLSKMTWCEILYVPCWYI